MKNPTVMRKLLWLDFSAGSSAGLAALLFLGPLVQIFGLPDKLIIFISVVTLIYAMFSLYMATRKDLRANWLRMLVAANWLWVLISAILLLMFYQQATLLGGLFLFLQMPVVGALAYVEAAQLRRVRS